MSMVYEDGKNLNRVFPGDPNGTAADRIAHTMVTKLFSITDYYIDLHSGDGYEQLHPYVYYVGVVDDETADASLHMARHIGVKYVVRSTTATGGAYNYAAYPHNTRFPVVSFYLMFLLGYRLALLDSVDNFHFSFVLQDSRGFPQDSVHNLLLSPYQFRTLFFYPLFYGLLLAYLH